MLVKNFYRLLGIQPMSRVRTEENIADVVSSVKEDFGLWYPTTSYEFQ